MTQTGYVFDLQHYSLHDGPGIRTTVFLSGCPLRCMWCQNPESYGMKPQISYRSDACFGCGACAAACPERAIERREGFVRTDKALCTACGTCVGVCPSEARSIIGKSMTVKEVYDEVASDKLFYDSSSGGLTISGGEALFQPNFSRSLLELCKEGGIGTAVETSGYADWGTVREVLERADLVLYDLKHMDPVEHRRGTGVSNALILENARRIGRELRLPMMIRVPVIPGFNDSDDNMAATASFVLKELGPDTTAALLPYHRMGIGKRVQLESEMPEFTTEAPDDAHMERLRAIFENIGVAAQIGG